MVAVPYCNKCEMKVDPARVNCPRCGSATRYKIMRRETADKLDGEEEGGKGYIRPPSS
jgi:hypothetical protein